MTSSQLARKLAKGNGKTEAEIEAILAERNNNIEHGGLYRAFNVPSYEKYEWLKENNMLRGKNENGKEI